MLKNLVKFLINKISSDSVASIIKEQLEKSSSKLTDEQKKAILSVATEVVKAAAAGAVSGTVNK